MEQNENSREESSKNMKTDETNGLSQAAGRLLMSVLGPSATELGEILVDELRGWRWRRKNIEDIARLQREEAKRRNIDADTLSPLPEGDAYRVIAACSMEEEELIQKLWAGLITSAMSPSSKVKITKAYIDILNSLGPAETAFLLLIQKMNSPLPNDINPQASHQEIHQIRKKKISEVNQYAEEIWRHYPTFTKESALQNLMRLRCIGFRISRQLQTQNILKASPMISHSDDFTLNGRGVISALDYLESLIMATSGTADVRVPSGRKNHNPEIPESVYDFTPLGRSLMASCKVEIEPSGTPDAPEQ